MLVETATPKKTSDSLITLVSASIGNNDSAGLTETLKTLAAETGACGCIIWELMPPSIEDGASNGCLFSLGQWLPDGYICNSTPPLNSTIGETILNKKSTYIEDVTKDSQIFIDPDFFRRTGIKSAFSIPVTFQDNATGAISLFRNHSSPFNPEEMVHVQYISSIIPALYHAIRNKTTLNLTEKIDKIFNRAETRKTGSVSLNHQVRRDYLFLCREIANAFRCVETSIFLEDPYVDPGVFHLAATTWPKPVNKKSYRKDPDEGLTGWILAHAKPIHIFDLNHFDDDREQLNTEYPGLKWKDSLRIKSAINEILKINKEVGMQPLSFMAVPIILGKKVLGVIRCCTVRDSYHFARRDLHLLRLVSARISQYWSNWLKQREAYEEHLSWRALVQGIGDLNQFVHEVLAGGDKDGEHHIYNKALEVAASVISGADILDVRLVDEEAQELYYDEVYGKTWLEGTPSEIKKRRERRFPIGGSTPTSAGAYVIKEGRTYLMTDVTNARYYSETFPNTKRMIIAPICLQGKCYGLLDIRGTGDRTFPKHARAIAEMICQLLGSYKYLANTFNKLRETDIQLEAQVRIQSQVHEDLAHQLKSPIFQAYARINSSLKDGTLDNALKIKLQAIRGLCSKAKQVTGSTGLFAALARGEKINPNLAPLWYDDLIKMLIEAARDSELMANPSRHIIFRVNRESLEALPTNKILAEVDHDLLQQAINNLLDNAGKYSFERTVVRINPSYDKFGQFYVAVTNEGLPIQAGDIQNCITRGWRSNLASQTTGEGSGIGLWIVQHIMEAHNGSLIISPTTSSNITEVRLVFPQARRHHESFAG